MGVAWPRKTLGAMTPPLALRHGVGWPRPLSHMELIARRVVGLYSALSTLYENQSNGAYPTRWE